MKITAQTTPQDVAMKTKQILNAEIIPNMLLKNAGKPNGFISEEDDYKFWIHRVCGREK